MESKNPCRKHEERKANFCRKWASLRTERRACEGKLPARWKKAIYVKTVLTLTNSVNIRSSFSLFWVPRKEYGVQLHVGDIEVPDTYSRGEEGALQGAATGNRLILVQSGAWLVAKHFLDERLEGGHSAGTSHNFHGVNVLHLQAWNLMPISVTKKESRCWLTRII